MKTLVASFISAKMKKYAEKRRMPYASLLSCSASSIFLMMDDF